MLNDDSIPVKAGNAMTKRLSIDLTIDVGPRNQHSEAVIRERVEHALHLMRKTLEENGMPIMRMQVHVQYTSHMFTVMKGDLFPPVLWDEGDEPSDED